MEYLLAAGGVLALLAVLAVLGTRALRRRELRKKAQTRLEWGDLAGAAKLFGDAGDLARAASLFREGGERLKAARLQIELKDLDSAIDALRGGRPEEIEAGAQLLSETGALQERGRASALASIARTAGLASLSASLFEKAGNQEEAHAARLQEARALAAQGKALEAAMIYEKLGEVRAAAAAHAEAARRETDPARKQALALRAANLLKQIHDLPGAAEALAVGGDIEGGVQLLVAAHNVAGAAQLLQWHGKHREAAQLFERAGDFKGAARALGLAGDVRQSASMLEKAGDTIGAVRLMLDVRDPKAAAEIHLRAGSRAAAAEILAGAGEVDSAVKIYLSVNDVDAAVELLCKRGRPRDAAALLEGRGETHRAAVLLAESGDLTQKARLLESKGDFEGGAQAWLDLGQPQEARAAMAHIAKPSALGRFLLARACMAMHEHEEAAQHFAALLDGPPRGIKRTDILYGLARAFEAINRVGEAITTLEELLVEDAAYRDAAFRVKLLKARLGGGGAGPIPLTHEAGAMHNATPSPSATLPPEWGGQPLAPGASTGRLDTSGRKGVPERYVVEKELGRGAMGVVYRALDSQLGRTVAIKVLERSAGADPRIREYFLREARAVAQLIHPNVVTLFDAGLEGSAPYLVMELVEGDDLRTRLQQGPLPMKDAVVLAAGVASALDAAHNRKIIHRDVKPENILVAPDGAAKLMDFGVAHVVAETGDRRATIIGTPVYMAPEQIRGEPIGGFTDTYALGVVLFECLTGVPPFDPNGALYHHVNSPPPDPRQLRPELPSPLAETVLRCLAKDPRTRFPSAKALSDALLALASSLAA
ncbi:MAG: protein kinase [Deltaproteobacteria bacterium]|nr:protein kinase [Deltaproteobacteria bacterium]